jgi:hypothetical protein
MSGLGLRAGEWVEVRSKEEILATLDKKGRLDELPFMPQMFAYCGQRLRVFKRAHKTCDTVNDYVGRRMKDAVHLEGIRCDGEAYSGCQTGCLIFWKEAWLKRVSGSAPRSGGSQLREPVSAARDSASEQCTELDVIAGTKKSAEPGRVNLAFVCQATQLPAATEPLPWWEWRQYLEDLTSRNVDVGRMLRGFMYMFYSDRIIPFRYRFAPFLRWLYDRFQSLWGGIPYPRRHGTIPVGEPTPTPTLNLNLQPGEWVRVKSYKAILATCDASDKNRGMKFDAEMVPYCGRSHRVLRRVTRILNEKTGEIQKLKNSCIILDGVVCQSRYSECRLFCPRSIYSFWREIWLERVPGGEPRGGSRTKKLAASTNSQKSLTNHSKRARFTRFRYHQ